jgi:hypothetical protein
MLSVTADPSFAAYYQGFESLGASCEFGLLQRHFGAEPLALLRWSAIDAQGLIHSLSNRFADVVDIANLSLIHGQNDEWDVRTPHFSQHLYVKRGTADAAELLRVTHRRIQFQRRAILETLEEAEKVLVYKEAQFRMTDAEIAQIFGLLRGFHADNVFLAVRLTGTGEEPGSVDEIEPGLWVGNVELDAKVVTRDTVPVASWHRICQTLRPV